MTSKPTYLWRGAEALAVLLSLLYTFLYINEHKSCFAFGIVGSLVFMVLTANKRIYAESFLHVFYAFMGVYGFLNWEGAIGAEMYAPSTHLFGILSCVALVVVVGKLLPRFTKTEEPWLDAFTTVFSLWATWLMVNFVHENWLYWIVIDIVAIVLYAKRGMYLGALLFAVYAAMAISAFYELNWFQW